MKGVDLDWPGPLAAVGQNIGHRPAESPEPAAAVLNFVLDRNRIGCEITLGAMDARDGLLSSAKSPHRQWVQWLRQVRKRPAVEIGMSAD